MSLQFLRRLSEAQVLSVRRRMAKTLVARRDAFGGNAPLYPDRLSSAVARQETALGATYKYDTVHAVAATLFYGLATGHAFENGNKRTAIIVMLVLLDANNVWLANVTEDELYDLATQVVSHEFPLTHKHAVRTADTEVQAVASWIRNRARRIVFGDKHLSFRELRKILIAFGCTFDKPLQNYIKIHRGNLSVKTGYPKANFDIAVSEIKRIRKALDLDATVPADRLSFYDIDARVDEFVGTYSELLIRLADA